MTAVPQFRAVHNEWNIECKVNMGMTLLHRNHPGYHFPPLISGSDRSSFCWHVPLLPGIETELFCFFAQPNATVSQQSLEVTTIVSMQQKARHATHQHNRRNLTHQSVTTSLDFPIWQEIPVTLGNKIFYDYLCFRFGWVVWGRKALDWSWRLLLRSLVR